MAVLPQKGMMAHTLPPSPSMQQGPFEPWPSKLMWQQCCLLLPFCCMIETEKKKEERSFAGGVTLYFEDGSFYCSRGRSPLLLPSPNTDQGQRGNSRKASLFLLPLTCLPCLLLRGKTHLASRRRRRGQKANKQTVLDHTGKKGRRGEEAWMRRGKRKARL